MSISRKTLVFGLTSVALGIAITGLASTHSRWAAAGLVASVLTAAVALAWALGAAEGLVVLLIIASLVDRYTFAVGLVNIRPEQIAALISLAVLLALRVRDRRLLELRPDLAEVFLLFWFVVGLGSSLLEAPSRSQSVKVLGLLLVSSLGLFLPRRLLEDDAQKLDRVVRWLLLALALEGAFAALAYFAHVFGPTISLSVNPAGTHLNAYGTLWEPNVLGAVSGAGAIAWAFLGPRYFTRAWIGTAICLAATAVSFARAAWLAVVIVLVISVATSVRARLHLLSLWRALAATAVVVVAMVAAEYAGKYTSTGGIRGGLEAVGNGSDLLGRVLQFKPVFDVTSSSWIIGGGIDSYGERHLVEGVQQHIGNLELAIFNDTGLLGLLLFVAFVVLIAMAAWRRQEVPTVFGLGAMVLVIGLANQATQTLELMITWLLMGLLVAAVARPSARTARDTDS